VPFQYYLLTILLLVAFYFDAKFSRIPNYLTVSGGCLGISYHFILYGWSGLKFSLIGLLIGFGILFLLYLFKAIGAGDVKLFGAIGALSGSELVMQSIMYSILYAGAIGICILLFRREFIQRVKSLLFRLLNFVLFRHPSSFVAHTRAEDIVRFPFMYAVLPGVITASYFYIFL
jgi:prepilin peptidase CpaA